MLCYAHDRDSITKADTTCVRLLLKYCAVSKISGATSSLPNLTIIGAQSRHAATNQKKPTKVILVPAFLPVINKKLLFFRSPVAVQTYGDRRTKKTRVPSQNFKTEKSLYLKSYSTDLDKIFRASSDHQCGFVGGPAHAKNESKMKIFNLK